jgi:hypothetical protein
LLGVAIYRRESTLLRSPVGDSTVTYAKRPGALVLLAAGVRLLLADEELQLKEATAAAASIAATRSAWSGRRRGLTNSSPICARGSMDGSLSPGAVRHSTNKLWRRTARSGDMLG